MFEDSPWLHKAHLSENNAQLRLLMGQALYHARDYKKAKEVFKNEFSSTGDDKIRQESLIWLARTYIRLKDFKNAKNILKTFIIVYADNTSDNQYREESIYRLAIIAKEEGDINLTTLLLRQLLAEKPSSSYRNDALWQLGWIYYTQGNLEKSLDTLKTLENSPIRMRAIYWQGKISLMLGRKDNALKLFKAAADSFPPNYYSAMSKKAAEKLGSKSSIIPASSYINKRQTKPNQANDSLIMKRAQRLLELGLNSLALKELASMDQRQYPISISLLYKDAGDIYHSYIIARNQSYSSAAFDYQLAFPEAYKELVERAAHKLSLDSFLIYAVMMQESEFDARAVSHAGAVGLLQIMPATGEMIAKKLSHQSFKEDDLFAPPLNINFGAWYLKTLITRFNGRLHLAIAAYNAGPNAVDEWLKLWGKLGMDEFVENIPYQETRKYVERVMGYYEAYQTIYNP
ncbi:MAG: transglycosylase SLT domain-containing protein [Deltaproteobacteria bacterium]|nr:transglycosylase SLT domain-containing protein [Deltaproteobacteria bacterium]